jgi:hypothetical protein
MLISEVALNVHGECATIFMAEPGRNGRDCHGLPLIADAELARIASFTRNDT